jgi:signal transduction histidine kinase
MSVLRAVVLVAFALLALSSARSWLRHRSRAAAWLALAFGFLAAGLVMSRLTPLLPTDVQVVIQRLARVAIVAFPYLLFRFTATLDPPRRATAVAAGVVTAGVLAASVAIPASPDPAPAWYLAYLIAAIGTWTWLSSWVVWRLWRAGQGMQPTVARTRLRTLGGAAAVLNLALVAAGIGGMGGGSAAIVAGTQVVAVASAGLFYLAFAPPLFVRSAWRLSDERALWRAESKLVASTTKAEVVEGMLPHISHLLGGGPALFLDKAGRAYSFGEVPAELGERLRSWTPERDGAALVDGVALLQLGNGRLGVAATPFTPLFADDELEFTIWLGTLVDLALERVELHDSEREARNRAEQLTSELEALVFGLTHDLRNPIVAVLGYLDCLTEDYGPRLDEEGRHFLSRLRTNAEYMDRLIGDLLELSRVGRVQEDRQSVDLGGVADEVAGVLREGHPRSTIVVGPMPEVMISPARARQLLTNLIANALVHSGRPDVTITVRGVESSHPGRACVTVTDDGRGVPEPYRTKVFGLFERLEHGDKDKGDGTGIGLAMCQRIVTHAGGHIWIADSDKGTDVRMELPLAALGVTR